MRAANLDVSQIVELQEATHARVVDVRYCTVRNKMKFEDACLHISPVLV